MVRKKKSLLSGRRILVIDDERFLTQEILTALQKLGADVIGPVATVAEALRLIEKANNIDGAIIDVKLQGEVVFPAADLLQRRGIPFVFAAADNPRLASPRYPGFVLTHKAAKLNEIAEALFGRRSRD